MSPAWIVFFKECRESLRDRRVLAEPEVYAGGGALDALLRIAPAEIVRVTNAETGDLVVGPAQGAESDG